MSTDILPWHEDEWRRICALIDAGRMPHALLISGPRESGKSLFASALGRRLLCKGLSPPCGACDQCHLIAAGTHPDFLTISPETSKQIRIEQVREVTEWASQTAQQGGRKVCLFNPADRLNVQAANALLKSLEEPPANTVICLVTEQPTRLLPTLRSRCQQVRCHLPPRDEALAWLDARPDAPGSAELLLDIAGGLPLRAANSIDEDYLALRRQVASQLLPVIEGNGSPIQAASELSESDPDEVLGILYQLVADAIVHTLCAGNGIRNSDLAETLAACAGARPVREHYRLLDNIIDARRALAGTSNANARMLLEWVLVTAA